MYKVLGADQKPYGPVDSQLVRQWIHERRLNAQSLVQTEGYDRWQPLATLPEFRDEFFPPALTSQAQWPTQVSASPPPSNPMATAGLALGIISIFPGFCCCSGFPFNILGLVFSILGLSHANRDPVRTPGKSYAMAGLILSLISLLLALFMAFFGTLLDQEQILRNWQF